MQTIEKFNMKKLLDIGKRMRYPRDFGYSQFRSKKSKYGTFEIKVIRDEDAQFVNLFGIFIDLKTGNIALGMFPRPNEYICCGNIYKEFSNLWFKSSKVPESVDMKYVVQLLKLDPIYYQDEIIQDIFYSLDSSVSESLNLKSISSNFIKNRFDSGKSHELDAFREITKRDDFIIKTIKKCTDIFLEYEDISRDYYGTFITEQYDVDMKKLENSSIELCINSSQPNLEALTVRYVKAGIPVVFLNAMKSYGFSITDRKNLFNRGRPSKLDRSSYSNKEIIDIGKSLSSMFYSRNVIKKEIILAYNFMDLLRAIGWEQNIFFALDLIVDMKSKVLWESIMTRFNMHDILREQKLSEREFVLAIDSYRKSVIDRVDWGMCYNRLATRDQYKMISYAPGHLESAGRVFELTLSTLKKNLQL